MPHFSPPQAVQERWERAGDTPALDPARACFRDRAIVCHDLFHIVTGYGTDGVGEATLLAFSQPEMRARSGAILTFGAVLEVWRSLGSPWLRYVHRAWKRGRRADHLLAQPWEDLLPLPLDQVREITGVAAIQVSHPGGILRGVRENDGKVALTH